MVLNYGVMLFILPVKGYRSPMSRYYLVIVIGKDQEVRLDIKDGSKNIIPADTRTLAQGADH